MYSEPVPIIYILYQKLPFVHINSSSVFYPHKGLALTMLCKNCNNPIPLLSSNFCSNCGAFLATPPPTPAEPDHIAWEENDQRYKATGVTLIKTLRTVLFHPDHFFSLIAKQKQRTGPAWAFALITGGAGLLASWFWSVLFLRYAGTASGIAWLFDGNAVSPATLLAAPLLISLEMLLLSFYIFCIMRLTRAEYVPFPQLFRTLCYTEAAMVIQIIPFLGTVIASVFWLYSLLTALHKLYAVNRLKLFILLLLPLFLIGLFLVIVLLAVLSGIIFTGGSTLANRLSQLPF